MKILNLKPLTFIKIIFCGILFFLYESLPLSVLLTSLSLISLDLLNLPLKRFINILIIPLGMIFAMNFGARVNPESMLSFFLFASVLKILQTNNNRDFFICILCLFFCLAGMNLFDSNIFMMLYTVLSLFILISLLGLDDFRKTNPERLKYNIKECFIAIGIAIPLVLVLFVFFPRMNSFFPSINTANTGQIGYNPEIKNNQIASLSGSSQIAFRAKVESRLAQSQLYWRGRTLDLTDGFNWNRRHHYRKKQNGSQKEIAKDVFSYSIELNQNFKGDLFVLRNSKIIDSTVSIFDPDETLDNTYIYLPTNKKVTYSAQSDLKSLTNLHSMKHYLQLPKTLDNKKILNLDKNLNIEMFQTSIQNYMFESGFSYSLAPGQMKSLSELLQNKKGFCTHYASLVAIIARQNEIPARIISGFQGGEYNEFGNYYIIRSNDAHAWLEVYLDNKWHRIDPTAYISPQRIELGGQAFISPFPMSFAFNLNQNNLNSHPLFQIYNQIKFYIDNKNVQVTSFFENFNRDYQKQIAKALNIRLETFYMMTLWGILIVVAVFFTFLFLKSKRNFYSPETKLEILFRKKIKKKYDKYHDHQTLYQIKAFADSEKELLIIDLLCKSKYAQDQIDLKILRKLVKKV